MPANPSFFHRLGDLGALRLMLLTGAVLCLGLRPAPGTAMVFSGWALAPTVIAPIITPLIVAVLMLDALMARVMMSDPEHGPPGRYRLAIALDLSMVAILAIRWFPYFAAIAE